MLKLDNSGKAESCCVDGDIKSTGGNIEEAAASYLEAHNFDSHYTMRHLKQLTKDQMKELTDVLESWLKIGEHSREHRCVFKQ